MLFHCKKRERFLSVQHKKKVLLAHTNWSNLFCFDEGREKVKCKRRSSRSSNSTDGSVGSRGRGKLNCFWPFLLLCTVYIILYGIHLNLQNAIVEKKELKHGISLRQWRWRREMKQKIKIFLSTDFYIIRIFSLLKLRAFEACAKIVWESQHLKYSLIDGRNDTHNPILEVDTWRILT